MAFEWIKASISKVQDLFESLRLPIVIDTFPPVDNAEINDWEHLIGVPFSPSHRAFFQVTNGLNIDYTYVVEDFPGVFSAGGNQIWITPIEQILEKTEHEKKWRDEAIADDNRPQDFWNNLIICAQMGNGYYVVMNPDNPSDSGEYRISYAENDYWPGYWRNKIIISDSFEEWIKRMFDTMVIRKETPEYWDCHPYIQLVSPTLLLPSGADQYDWTVIDMAGNGNVRRSG